MSTEQLQNTFSDVLKTTFLQKVAFTKSPLVRRLESLGKCVHTGITIFKGLESIFSKYKVKLNEFGLCQPNGEQEFHEKFHFKKTPTSFSHTRPVTEEDLSEESVSIVSFGHLVCIQALIPQK